MKIEHRPPAPEGNRALVLTFDNLGEASELERGTWPQSEPLGRHPSVRLALPRLLQALDAYRLSATFFVEAINCELYPEALREIVARGHELGMHGWRHEAWRQLAAADERRLLARGARAFAALGLEVRAFRPPGGALTERTPQLLREFGYRWCSAAGGEPAVGQGLASVPFEWELVDAYYLMERFAGLRGRSAPFSAASVTERFTAALVAGRDTVQTLVLHPFLMLDGAWWRGVQEVLACIAALSRDGRLVAMPGGRYVERMTAAVTVHGG